MKSVINLDLNEPTKELQYKCFCSIRYVKCPTISNFLCSSLILLADLQEELVCHGKRLLQDLKNMSSWMLALRLTASLEDLGAASTCCEPPGHQQLLNALRRAVLQPQTASREPLAALLPRIQAPPSGRANASYRDGSRPPWQPGADPLPRLHYRGRHCLTASGCLDLPGLQLPATASRPSHARYSPKPGAQGALWTF